MALRPWLGGAARTLPVAARVGLRLQRPARWGDGAAAARWGRRAAAAEGRTTGGRGRGRVASRGERGPVRPMPARVLRRPLLGPCSASALPRLGPGSASARSLLGSPPRSEARSPVCTVAFHPWSRKPDKRPFFSLNKKQQKEKPHTTQRPFLRRRICVMRLRNWQSLRIGQASCRS